MRPALPALALLLAAAPALADTTRLHGDILQLSTGLDASINIEPDASLSHEVRITSDQSCGTMRAVGPVVMVNTDACVDGSGSMVIAVPPGFPVSVSSHGDGDVRLGNTGGPVSATLAGGGKLVAGRIGPLNLVIRGDGDATAEAVSGGLTSDITGSGNLRVRTLTGPVRSSQRGSGDLAIGAITSPSVELTMEGSGDALLGTGSIDALRAELHGPGDLGVSAVIVDAEVHASGGGDVKLGQVTGQLRKEASGGSDIYVGAGVVSTGLGKLADIVSDPANDHTVTVHGGDGNTAWHVVAAAIVLALLYLLWRTVRRRGGVAALQGRMRAAGAPEAAAHPGVITVRDTVTRLDARLAKLESYVTSREFDLHRKFRELDTH